MFARLESASPPPRATRPIDRAWAASVFLIPMFLALLARLGTVDLAYHIRAGEEILREHAIPSVDTYTFTIAGRAWLDQQWGAQLVFALLTRMGGFSLLALTRAVLPAIAFSFVYLACRHRGAPPRTAAILTILAYVVAIPTVALRPQLLALPLFATTLWALASRGTAPARLWAIPVAALIVANLHGSFVLFPLAVGLAFVDDVLGRRPLAKRLALVTAVTAAATLVNPFGIHAWTYAYGLSTNQVIRETISEWAPVTLPNVIGFFTIGSMVAVAVILARRGRSLTWGDLLWLAVFALMALAAIRAIVWWTLVAPITLASLFAAPTPVAAERESRTPAIAIVGTLAVAIALFLPWWRPGGVPLGDAPPGLLRAVAALPSGSRVFAYQPWASWLEYAYPDETVFSDSRIEIFPARIWHDYSQIAFAGAGWKDVLARWQPDAVMADKDWDIIPYLEADPAWKVEYRDEDGVLFVPAG